MRGIYLNKLTSSSVDPASLFETAWKFQDVKPIFIQHCQDEIAAIGNPIEGNDEVPYAAKMAIRGNSALI